MSMNWSSRERNRSCSLVSRRSRGRIANLRSISPSEKNQIRGNPHNRICKKIALQQPKTGKFDYLSEPNHPAHSMAFKFFTDDERQDPDAVARFGQGAVASKLSRASPP